MCQQKLTYIEAHTDFFLSFKDFIHLLLERWEGKEKERERNINVREKLWLVICHTCPEWGPNPQSRQEPWLGITMVTFHFVRWHQTHWAIYNTHIHVYLHPHWIYWYTTYPTFIVTYKPLIIWNIHMLICNYIYTNNTGLNTNVQPTYHPDAHNGYLNTQSL